MRVFVAGATGAIGRRLVPRLVAAGHEVTGMTRSEEKAGGLREAGARAVVADALDEDAVHDAMREAAPEAVIHQLTALPDRLEYSDKALAPTNRLRSEGTRVLLAAAQGAGARRLVAQSIAFLYEPTGDRVKREDEPLARDSPGHVTDALRELERQVTHADGLEGLVLRYGYFYGPGTHFAADGGVAEDFRKRRFPVIGRGQAVYSFIHVDDAAEATVAALERGAPGIYNVVDDEPAPLREWAPAYAQALDAGRPLRAPKLLARLVVGKQAAEFATAMRGASNEKAKRELGWQPAYPSWRQGFREALG
jgi:nucleoside-diphosphate-sugar epimerase